jgi:cysteinyl-tRNA synthetase
MLESIAHSLGSDSSATSSEFKQLQHLEAELRDQALRLAAIQRKYDDDCHTARSKLEAAAGMIEELQEVVVYHHSKADAIAKCRRSQVSSVCKSASRNLLLMKALLRWSWLSTRHRYARLNELQIENEGSRSREGLQTEQMHRAELEEALGPLCQRNRQLESIMAEMVTRPAHDQVCSERDQLRGHLHSQNARLEMLEEENRLNRRNVALKAQAMEGMSHEVTLLSFLSCASILGDDATHVPLRFRPRFCFPRRPESLRRCGQTSLLLRIG